MPTIQDYESVDPAVLRDPASGWRPLHRIDSTGAHVIDVIDAISAHNFERLVYAEGDSWFDKFTPIPLTGTNLLDAIRTPFAAAVVDVSHIGDEAQDMVKSWQARRTREMFRLLSFDAIVLSAGGNDLRNLFSELIASQAPAIGNRGATRLEQLATPPAYAAYFDGVIASIKAFVRMRDDAGDARTRAAPIILHGYDFLQPRPAGATVFAGSAIGKGPWIYPILAAVNFSDAEMKSMADDVVGELNTRLQNAFANVPDVFVLDQRGLLTPAAGGSTGDDADWLDEIHPNSSGFTKLARKRWDVVLSEKLGWPRNQAILNRA